MTAVVAGIGEVRAARGRTPSAHALAGRAVLAALRDAGLRIEDVDGVVRYDRDAAWEYDLPGVSRVRRLDWYAAVPVGAGSAPALVGMAAMAVAQGRASVVVGWHARDGAAQATDDTAACDPATLGAASLTAAVAVRRWQHEHRLGARARAAALGRRVARAAGSPFPATGAGAFVVVAAERLERVRRPPVPVIEWTQAALPNAARDLVSWLAPRHQRAVRRVVSPDVVEIRFRAAGPESLEKETAIAHLPTAHAGERRARRRRRWPRGEWTFRRSSASCSRPTSRTCCARAFACSRRR